jgi:hypothetical protein
MSKNPHMRIPFLKEYSLMRIETDTPFYKNWPTHHFRGASQLERVVSTWYMFPIIAFPRKLYYVTNVVKGHVRLRVRQ